MEAGNNKMYVDNGPAIAFMIIMIIIIIFLVLALTIPTGNGCRRQPNDCYFGSGASAGPNVRVHRAAAAARFGTDGILEASGLGQNFPTYEQGKVNGQKLGYNRDLDVVQDSHGHDFPVLFTQSKETREIAKQGMKPARNQIFVNRIDMNPGMCGGVSNDIYMSALFGEDDDSVVMHGVSGKAPNHGGNGGSENLIHLITNEAHARKVLEDNRDKIVIVASHGCGACRGLMQDLHHAAEKDPQVKHKLTSGSVHFIEAGAFGKANGHQKLGQVSGIPTIFHLKNGEVHKKLVGKRPAREVLGL